jgi:hypothetical protein
VRDHEGCRGRAQGSGSYTHETAGMHCATKKRFARLLADKFVPGERCAPQSDLRP